MPAGRSTSAACVATGGRRRLRRPRAACEPGGSGRNAGSRIPPSQAPRMRRRAGTLAAAFAAWLIFAGAPALPRSGIAGGGVATGAVTDPDRIGDRRRRAGAARDREALRRRLPRDRRAGRHRARGSRPDRRHTAVDQAYAGATHAIRSSSCSTAAPQHPELPTSWAWESPLDDYFTVVQWDQRGCGQDVHAERSREGRADDHARAHGRRHGRDGRVPARDVSQAKDLRARALVGHDHRAHARRASSRVAVRLHRRGGSSSTDRRASASATTGRCAPRARTTTRRRSPSCSRSRRTRRARARCRSRRSTSSASGRSATAR